MPTLGSEEIKRWFRARLFARRDRDLNLKSMLRGLSIDHSTFFRWLRGKPRGRISPAQQRLLGRFIEDWDAGLIEFVPDRSRPRANGAKGRLVHRTTPRPMPVRMVVDLSGGRPRLQLLGKPVRDRFPSLPEISGKLTPK
jgi:hypothetical protein